MIALKPLANLLFSQLLRAIKLDHSIDLDQSHDKQIFGRGGLDFLRNLQNAKDNERSD